MEPRAPQRKVNEAVALYEAALLYISLAVAARSTASFASVNVNSLTATAGTLINLVVTSSLAGYVAAQALSRAFGRLMRGVWTGTTTATDELAVGEKTSLAELYREFEAVALSHIPEERREEVLRLIEETPEDEAVNLSSLYPQSADKREEGQDRYAADSDLLELEAQLREDSTSEAFEGDIEDWPFEDDIEAEQEELEQYLADLAEAQRYEEQRLREALRKEMRENFATKIKIAKRRKSEKIAERRLERAIAEARTKVAGEASKTAQAGARDEAMWAGARSERVLGWARVPGSANPCYFCLALISLGAFYSSPGAAMAMSHTQKKGDEFHEHCYCEVIQVYSWEHYLSDPALEVNRTMYYLWRELGGGLRSWRDAVEELYEEGGDIAGVVRNNAAKHK